MDGDGSSGRCDDGRFDYHVSLLIVRLRHGAAAVVRCVGCVTDRSSAQTVSLFLR